MDFELVIKPAQPEKGVHMNPESLLHTIAEQLRAEAVKGPGTMFLLHTAVGFFVTRAPSHEQTKAIVVKYDCQRFCDGLTSNQWSSLMKKAWAVQPTPQKGAAGEQQPAKPAQANKP